MRRQFEAYAAAREAMLPRAVGIAGEWIAGLQDPEAGAVGEAFLQRFAETGCQQELDPQKTDLRAVYTSFSYAKDAEGFINRILYGMQAGMDLAALFSARVHESVHALQKKAAAALHAAPFNSRTRIIICPQDWIMLQERCEQDAYAKQAWFSSLLARDLDEVASRSGKEPVPVPAFMAMRQESGSLQQALTGAARHYLQKNYYSDDGDFNDYKFPDSDHDFALKCYKAAMDIRRGLGEKDFVFVRLGPKDREAMVRAIGGSFGPNTFGEGRILPEFLEDVKLRQRPNTLVDPKSARARLDDLNRELRITDYSVLPELSDVLATRGMTPESFVASSYAAPPPATGGSQPSPP